VEPNDSAALAAGLRRLMDDPALRRRLGEDGQKSVRARFTAERMARETADVLAQYHHQRTPASAEAVPS
jgi:glycosyltransferase involved in cell wall biosynthesis